MEFEEKERTSEFKESKESKGKSAVSNLITDPELTEMFQIEATRVAGSLYYKFYQVYETMEVDDVVSECWQKIIRQNISYDPTKGAKFNTFVRMIVTQRLIDLTRSLNTGDKIPYTVSLEEEVEFGSNTSTVTRKDIIPDTSSETNFNLIEIVSEIDQYRELFSTIPKIDEILELFVEGYTIDEVVEITGVYDVWVNRVRRTLNAIRKHKQEGSAKSLADIMYGESQEWLPVYISSKSPEVKEQWKKDTERRDHLTFFCWMITDKETGINLGDIVRLIIRGFTYKKICNSLKNMSMCLIDEGTGKPIYAEDGSRPRVKKYHDIEFNEYTIKRVVKKYEEILI